MIRGAQKDYKKSASIILQQQDQKAWALDGHMVKKENLYKHEKAL